MLHVTEFQEAICCRVHLIFLTFGGKTLWKLDVLWHRHTETRFFESACFQNINALINFGLQI